MACAAGSDASAGRKHCPGIMNSKTELGTVELLLLCCMALAWAVVAIARAVLVPLVALTVVLLTPRRRPAPQPIAPAPVAATVEATAPERVLACPAPAAPLAALAAELMELPAAELRRLAGTKSKLSKTELIARLVAMPI